MRTILLKKWESWFGTVFLKNGNAALAGVAQWIEYWPANQRVAGWIPRQGTCLGCGPGPQSGGAQEATTH